MGIHVDKNEMSTYLIFYTLNWLNQLGEMIGFLSYVLVEQLLIYSTFIDRALRDGVSNNYYHMMFFKCHIFQSSSHLLM